MSTGTCTVRTEQPLKVVFSYSHDDFAMKEELRRAIEHLTVDGVAEFWDDGALETGVSWQQQTFPRFKNADAGIVLVSPSYLRSSICVDKEFRILVDSQKEAGFLLLPVLIVAVDLESHPWLQERHMLPVVKGQLRPLRGLLRREKDAVYQEIARRLAERHRGGRRGRLLPPLTESEAIRAASRLAEKYRDTTARDDVIRELVAACVQLSSRKLTKLAIYFANRFENALETSHVHLSDRIHRCVVDLLVLGLPHKPEHLQDISTLDADSLLGNPGYPDLLAAIRLMESKYDSAITKMEQVRRDWPGLAGCPLGYYASGQAYRKLENFWRAEADLQTAIRNVRRDQETCAVCEVGCRCDRLSVSIYRGLATVYRKQDRISEAQEHFRRAEDALTTGVPARIQADLFYSAGYLSFELACKPRLPGFVDKTLLQSAMTQFNRSIELAPDWDAPVARLAIVQWLLGGPEFLVTYRAAYALASAGQGPETPLTAAMCAFAVLLEEGPHPDLPTPPQLFGSLVSLFESVLVGKGPAACHAFDMRVILADRRIKDPSLKLVYEFVQQAGLWSVTDLASQQALLHSFLAGRPEKEGCGKTGL
jgi:tetratricopeptide (TPR) repeat protein